jgi:hypothetical protein
MKARRVRGARVEAFILMEEWCLEGDLEYPKKRKRRV